MLVRTVRKPGERGTQQLVRKYGARSRFCSCPTRLKKSLEHKMGGTVMSRITDLGLIAGLLLSACGENSSGVPGACTASVDPGLMIRVLDNASGSPISCGARAVVTASGYSEVVENSTIPSCSDTGPLLAAFERPGTYAITVSKMGYFDFAASNVTVTAGTCHVKTVTVEARLIAR